MRVLMLGWEWPPELTGGLGRACEALVNALTRQEVSVIFVLPRSPLMGSAAEHVELVGSDRLGAKSPSSEVLAALAAGGIPLARAALHGLESIAVPSLLSPYDDPGEYAARRRTLVNAEGSPRRKPKSPYGVGLFDEIQRYARTVSVLAKEREFDLIHAHDWMTWPAAIALRQLSGKPFIAHVHSTEYDRSPDFQNPTILGIEQRALLSADHVIAVSAFSRDRIVQHYGVAEERIEIIHNGSPEADSGQNSGQSSARLNDARPDRQGTPDKDGKTEHVVLFLGRLTKQKAPEVFIEAASHVLATGTRARFVVCGEGAKLVALQQLTTELGIDKHVEFRGFVDPEQVSGAYAEADVFVLPSAAEPFGLTALEAAREGVPVILSESTGVAEVLLNSLRFETGNAHQLADRILACLRFPALREALRSQAKSQVARISWDGQSRLVSGLYTRLCE